MKHTFMFALILLSGSLAMSQPNENYTQWMPISNQADTAGFASSTENIRVDGCLTRAGHREFMLTDASGLHYYMNGHRKQLEQMAGQEVHIAGIASPSRNPSTAGAIAKAASPEGVSPHITIISVHGIAASCPSNPRRQ